MRILVDSDTLCFLAALPAERQADARNGVDERVWTLAKWLGVRVDKLEHFIGGGKYFRHAINPEYKGNRDTATRPQFLDTAREYLVEQYGAQQVHGHEGEDLVSLEYQHGDLIVHIDKDLDQLPGEHANYIKQIWYTVTKEQAWRNFFTQMLRGDSSDNVKGVPFSRPAVILKDAHDELSMWRAADAHWRTKTKATTNEIQVVADLIWLPRETHRRYIWGHTDADIPQQVRSKSVRRSNRTVRGE